MQEHIVDSIADRLAQNLQASDGSLQGLRFILAFLRPPGLLKLTRLSQANPFGASLSPNSLFLTTESPSLCHTLAPKAEARVERLPGL
jgi:hypothetical protein